MTKIETVKQNLLNAYTQRDNLRHQLAQTEEAIKTCQLLLEGVKLGAEKPEVSE